MNGRFRWIALTLTAAATLLGCGSPRFLATPLLWKPTDDVADLHAGMNDEHGGWSGAGGVTYGAEPGGSVVDAFAGQQLQVLPFTDARSRTDAIGSNQENDTPRPVVTQDNVPEFVTANVAGVLRDCRVPVVADNASRVLRGQVLEYFVTEGNRYEGSVLLGVTLTDAQGAVLWQGTVRGHQSKWGRSFSAENYAETLSDSTLRAVHQLLLDPSFLTAVHKGVARPAGS